MACFVSEPIQNNMLFSYSLTLNLNIRGHAWKNNNSFLKGIGLIYKFKKSKIMLTVLEVAILLSVILVPLFTPKRA